MEWHGGDDDSLVGDQRCAQACGDSVVKDPLPGLGDDDLGHDERERHVRALAVQSFPVTLASTTEHDRHQRNHKSEDFATEQWLGGF
jgi:hypothetical protein